MIDTFKNTTHHLYSKAIDSIAPYSTKENRETVEKVGLIAGAIIIASVYRYFSSSNLDSSSLRQDDPLNPTSPSPTRTGSSESIPPMNPSNHLASPLGIRGIGNNHSPYIEQSPSAEQNGTAASPITGSASPTSAVKGLFLSNNNSQPPQESVSEDSSSPNNEKHPDPSSPPSAISTLEPTSNTSDEGAHSGHLSAEKEETSSPKNSTTNPNNEAIPSATSEE